MYKTDWQTEVTRTTYVRRGTGSYTKITCVKHNDGWAVYDEGKYIGASDAYTWSEAEDQIMVILSAYFATPVAPVSVPRAPQSTYPKESV